MTSMDTVKGRPLNWERLGLIYQSSSNHEWHSDSALQPTVLALDDGVLRIYFGARDKQGISRVSFIDVHEDAPGTILAQAQEPCLDIGSPGHFDDNGVVPCCVKKMTDHTIRLYYAGYNLQSRVRFTVFSGLAESHDGGLSFQRKSIVPITERREGESLFRVIHSMIEDNGLYRVWYGGGNTFATGERKTLPVYNIRTQTSPNGVDFSEPGSIALDISNGEHRLGRPQIISNFIDKYAMFYGYGSDDRPYQLGLALSNDGITWVRKDHQLGLPLSGEGFDSQMMAYPCPIKTKHGMLLFYNGNNYGHAGIGAAFLPH